MRQQKLSIESNSNNEAIAISPTTLERLSACAIKRDGVVHSYGFKSHSDIRQRLGDKDPYTTNISDIDGFITSIGRFVGRFEANKISSEAGQCPMLGRELLSSDIDW